MFSYSQSVGNIRLAQVSLNVQGGTVEAILEKAFAGTGVKFHVNGNKVDLILSGKPKSVHESVSQKTVQSSKKVRITGVVIDGADKRISCTPPHDVPGQPFRPRLVNAEVPDAQETADLLNDLILKSQQVLMTHPLNLRRIAEGKDPANSIWPWGGGYHPQMEWLSNRFMHVHSGTVITAVDLIRGIGHYAGLEIPTIEGATGLYDTNYEKKVEVALNALKTQDFVYLHVEASDEAGHEGNAALKKQTIENLDKRVVAPIYNAVKEWETPVAIAVLPDHPTPCSLRTHTAEPVPFLIWHSGIEPDDVEVFNETTAINGAYGLLKKDEFIENFMNL
jgi:2,3-bisphosphoglycerate-independent phosphoglycerate mutase